MWGERRDRREDRRESPFPVLGLPECFGFSKERIAIGWEHVVEPVKGLNDAHRRPSRPKEPARSSQFEVDDESLKVNGAEPGMCVERDFRGHRVSESQLIGGRHPIREKSGLGSTRDRIDDCGVIGRARLPGQPVDSRNVVYSAINAPEITRKCETLECLIDGGSGTEIQEVIRRPNKDGFIRPNAVEDGPLEIKIGAALGRR
jgi:hypothetical protein